MLSHLRATNHICNMNTSRFELNMIEYHLDSFELSSPKQKQKKKIKSAKTHSNDERQSVKLPHTINFEYENWLFLKLT